MRLAMQHPWILAVMLALALAEWSWRRRDYDRRAALASLAVALGQALFRPLGAIVVAAAMTGIAALTPLHWPPGSAWTWIAGFLAVDFVYYWFHRLSHTTRLMWATHAVHHTSPQFVLPSAIRLGWTELFSLGWLFFAGVVALGFPPQVVALLLGANLIYQFPLHTEAVGSLGPLEQVFNTPARHRAHHASDADLLDCNFGGVLIVWDRLFGTLRSAPASRALTFGLVHGTPTDNPLRIALGEWQRLLADLAAARGARARLRVLLARP